MSNTTKETLFELIKSLNKSEKRYIKLYLNKHLNEESSTSNLLYDYLVNKNEYNEQDILIKFKKYPFVNKFSITKKRLYNHILFGLESFHLGKSIEAQIFRQLAVVDVLISKSLYAQSLKIINSIEKTASKNNLSTILVVINDKKKKILESAGVIPIIEINNIATNDEILIKKIEIKNKLFAIKSKLFSLLSVYGRKNIDKISSELEADIVYVNNILGINEKNKLNEEILFLSYHILSAYYFAINNLEKSKIFLEKNCKIFENNNNFKDKNLYQYLSILNNLSFIYAFENSYNKLIEIKQKIDEIKQRAIEENNEDLQIKSFISNACLNIKFVTNTIFFKNENNIKTIYDIENGIENYNDRITPQRKAYLFLKISIYYLQNKLYKESLKYIHKILQNKEFDSFQEIIDIVHVIHLFNLIETQNNKIWINRAIRKAQKNIVEKNEIVQLILKYINKINKAENLIAISELWEELHYKINNLKKEFNKINYDYLDILNWIDNKAKYKENYINNISK